MGYLWQLNLLQKGDKTGDKFVFGTCELGLGHSSSSLDQVSCTSGMGSVASASHDSRAASAQFPIATFVAAVFACAVISFCSMIFAISASASSPYCANTSVR